LVLNAGRQIKGLARCTHCQWPRRRTSSSHISCVFSSSCTHHAAVVHKMVKCTPSGEWRENMWSLWGGEGWERQSTLRALVISNPHHPANHVPRVVWWPSTNMSASGTKQVNPAIKHVPSAKTQKCLPRLKIEDISDPQRQWSYFQSRTTPHYTSSYLWSGVSRCAYRHIAHRQSSRNSPVSRAYNPLTNPLLPEHHTIPLRRLLPLSMAVWTWSDLRLPPYTVSDTVSPARLVPLTTHPIYPPTTPQYLIQISVLIDRW